MIKSTYLYPFITGIILGSCDLRNSDSANNLSASLAKRKSIEENEQTVTSGDKQTTSVSDLLITIPAKKKQELFNQENAIVGNLISAKDTEDRQEKEIVENREPASYETQMFNNTTAGGYSTPDQIKGIRQRLEETHMQDPIAQKAMLQVIVEGRMDAESFAREDCIPFVLEHAKQGEKDALLALLWFFKKYPKNSLLISHDLDLKLYEDLLVSLRERTGDSEIDGRNAFYIARIYSCTVVKGFQPAATKAIEYYEMAIQLGNANAAFNLANLYKNGIKDQLEPDLTKAIEYYEKAIQLECADAAFNLGLLYQEGVKDQLEPDATKAIQYYELANQLGNSRASLGLALLYHQGIKGQLEPNATKAIHYYKMAIQLGNAKADFCLALLYEHGIRDQLEPNATKAIQYYEKAIQLGHANASFNLANLYEDGIKDQLEPNVTKAIQHYEKAIQLGDADAANNLAILYKDGIKDQLVPDGTKAIQYYEMAIHLGDADAANNLANLYSDGIKDQLEPNVTKAIQYYEMAIELGNANAANNLANLYSNGIKDQLEPNVTKAIQYYEKAIQLGDADAAFNLGLLYQQGIKDQLEPHATKAIQHYEKAIQLGDADAANNLATLYKNGIKDQLEPNVTKTIEYYEKAIRLGDADAAFNLANLYEYGIKDQLQPSKQLAFKTYHDTYLATKNEELCKYLRKFIIRNSSTDIVLSDLEESNQSLNIFIENVELLAGFMILKQEENNPFSQAIHFMDNYMIPELLPCYTALSEYLDDVLKITKCLSEPAFMVDCIKIKYKHNKKCIENGDHLHEYTIDDNSYLCLGKKNVKAAMVLIGLLENEHMVQQNIVEIKKFFSESPDSELGKRLQEQASKKLPENYAGTLEEYIAKRLEETLDMLDKVEIVYTQLKEIVLVTTMIRNKGCAEVYPFFFEK